MEAAASNKMMMTFLPNQPSKQAPAALKHLSSISHVKGKLAPQRGQHKGSYPET